MRTWIKEHKAACRLAAFDRYAIVEHAWQEGHKIERNDVEIVDTAKDLQGEIRTAVLFDEQR